MDMKEIQRHYFSPDQAVELPQHKLEVWPGFITSIHQYEQNIMLCMELSHKVLRTDTVLDKMYEVFNNPKRGSPEDMCKELMGQIVLTR